MHLFLLSFLMNVNNLKPVVVTNCQKVSSEFAKRELLIQVDKLTKLGMICDQPSYVLSYACVSSDQQRVGKVVVMKDEGECKKFPQKMSSDLKALMNLK